MMMLLLRILDMLQDIDERLTRLEIQRDNQR